MSTKPAYDEHPRTKGCLCESCTEAREVERKAWVEALKGQPEAKASMFWRDINEKENTDDHDNES